MGADYISENVRFLTKYGHESNDFLWKSEEKKKATYWYFLPIIECSCDRIDVFLTNHVHDRKGFFMKNLKKNDIRAPCCEKMDIFWQNMGMRATCFLENGHFCQKWAKKQWFFMKYREKIQLTFFAHNIQLWQNTFFPFLPIMGMTTEGFPWKSWQKWHEKTVFLRK